MERQTMIERSADAIGQTYTQALHDAWVAHLAAVERLAQDVIALRDTEHRRSVNEATAAARSDLLRRREARNARTWGESVPGSEDAV